MSAPSPLVGYNHNFQYRGALYHVQTEDTGQGRAYIVTHVFAAGGWVIGSAKTHYDHLLTMPDLETQVRALMQRQHKAMVVALRNGEFDEIIDCGPPSRVAPEPIGDGTATAHTLHSTRLVSELPPPPLPERNHFNDVTVLLDRLAPDMGAAVVDIKTTSAVSLRHAGCASETGELVAALLESFYGGFGTEADLVYIDGDMAFAIIHRGTFVLFLESSLAGKLASQRFRAVAHQVHDLLDRRAA